MTDLLTPYGDYIEEVEYRPIESAADALEAALG
jgi:hypothetical protein